MSFSINGFRSNLIGGGARPSLFEVSLNFPTLFKLSSAFAMLQAEENNIINKIFFMGMGLDTLYEFHLFLQLILCLN